jgi:adenylate cyclase
VNSEHRDDEFVRPRYLGYSESDRATITRRLAEAGASEEEIAEAGRSGTLGALALDLALRPAGELVSLADAAASAGVSLEQATMLWRALGFAVPSDGSLRLTSAEATVLQVLMGLGREVVGEERILGFARVLGWATAVLGEALVDAFRIQVEVPRLRSGTSYAEIVEHYTQLAEASFPTFVDGLGVLTRAHMVGVSRSAWTPDEQRSAVTRERTIGFADLVGYTGHSRGLSTTELAFAVTRFETQVTDLVSRFGGRLVKFIGDEAMFIVEDPSIGCELGLALVENFASDPDLPPVRVGLAAGPTVALHGDYYGEVVNLASRLVKACEPSQVIVSGSLRQAVGERFVFEPASELTLKGFDFPVAGFRLLRHAH